MYANIDGVSVEDCKENFKVDYENREEIDKWLLSKYNRLVKNVNDDFTEYDLNKVVHHLATFVSDDLSNWYIRRNRDRFWGSELNDYKKSVYLTTYEVLVGLSKLIAPICPFISEEIFRGLTGEESVHLTDFPVSDKTLINDKIETKMDLVRDLISLGRGAREEVKIKVRQPLSEVVLDGKNKKIISDLTDLIKEELNVHEVTFTNDLATYMTFEVKPNFKVCGKMFGANIKEFQSKLMELTDSEIKSLQDEVAINMEIAGENVSVTHEMVDIRINAKDGFDAAYANNNFVVLNTTLTDELIDEGIVRELISKVQNLRKTKDFNIMDRINIYYSSETNLEERLSKYLDFIKKETLCDKLINEKKGELFNLNGIDTYLDVERK
jgi:isoleucyl-tRNA synthetase